ncbi:uncharacterized protein VTP21DRAFT_3624 [Calcarisporiella thermophila]|uniref:uncharacterized protein n=1 Tax=Calcarisporiella thermophila TaxID=911321 RepID=UPI00374362BE
MFKNCSLVLLPLALLGFFCPSFASSLAEEDYLVDKRCAGYDYGYPCGYCDYGAYGGYPCGGYGGYGCYPCGGYGGYGCYPFIYNNAYYANAANVDNCFDHRANLAANVKANECTDAANNANVFNVASTTNTVAKRCDGYRHHIPYDYCIPYSCCVPYSCCTPYYHRVPYCYDIPYGCDKYHHY